MKWLTIFILSTSFVAASCDFLRMDPDVEMVKEFIQKNGDLEEYWPGYDLKKMTVVLTKLQVSTNCFAVLLPGKDVAIHSTNTPLSLVNKYFSWMTSTTEAEPSFNSALRGLNISSAYIQDLSDLAFIYGEGGEHMGKKETNLSTLIHEGFHYLVQMEGQAPWNQSVEAAYTFDRFKMDALCYQDKRFESIFAAESLALDNLSQATIKKNLKEMKLQLQLYYGYRDQRRELVKDVLVPSYAPGLPGTLCKDAETTMELIEGTPDFVADIPLLEMGIQNPFMFRMNNLASSITFYAIGASKLHALKVVLGSQFGETMDELMKEPKPDLDALLKRVFEVN